MIDENYANAINELKTEDSNEIVCAGFKVYNFLIDQMGEHASNIQIYGNPVRDFGAFTFLKIDEFLRHRKTIDAILSQDIQEQMEKIFKPYNKNLFRLKFIEQAQDTPNKEFLTEEEFSGCLYEQRSFMIFDEKAIITSINQIYADKAPLNQGLFSFNRRKICEDYKNTFMKF